MAEFDPIRGSLTGFQACFVDVSDDGKSRKLSGFIEHFPTIQTTNDDVKYDIVPNSHIARLAAVTRNKIFQHASTPDILAESYVITECASINSVFVCAVNIQRD